MPGLEDLYREIILDHYRNPRNRGELDTPPAHRVEGFNPLCGDEIVVFVDVDNDTVADIKINGQGCSISQSSASMMSVAIKGKPIDEVAAIRADDLLDLLGIDISPARLKCAMLSHDSLQHTLTDLGVEQQATA